MSQNTVVREILVVKLQFSESALKQPQKERRVETHRSKVHSLHD
jgi:hypothetical protein